MQSFSPITPLNAMNYVSTLLAILEGSLRPDALPNRADQPAFELVFVFACVWAFGGALCEKDGISYRCDPFCQLSCKIWTRHGLLVYRLSMHSDTFVHAATSCYLVKSIMQDQYISWFDLKHVPQCTCCSAIPVSSAFWHASLLPRHLPSLLCCDCAGRTSTNGGKLHGQQSSSLERGASLTTTSTIKLVSPSRTFTCMQTSIMY